MGGLLFTLVVFLIVAGVDIVLSSDNVDRRG